MPSPKSGFAKPSRPQRKAGLCFKRSKPLPVSAGISTALGIASVSGASTSSAKTRMAKSQDTTAALPTKRRREAATASVLPALTELTDCVRRRPRRCHSALAALPATQAAGAHAGHCSYQRSLLGDVPQWSPSKKGSTTSCTLAYETIHCSRVELHFQR